MTEKLYYLAYGSNLHPLRLQYRVPSARFVTTLRLRGYQLRFHKTGQDKSAKADMYKTGHKKDYVYAAIYEIAKQEKTQLDKIEGLGKGYILKHFEFGNASSFSNAFAYVAQRYHRKKRLKPFNWYHELVLKGALHHRFPNAYINKIQKIKTKPDLSFKRNRTHQQLLAKIKRNKLKSGFDL